MEGPLTRRFPDPLEVHSDQGTEPPGEDAFTSGEGPCM